MDGFAAKVLRQQEVDRFSVGDSMRLLCDLLPSTKILVCSVLAAELLFE